MSYLLAFLQIILFLCSFHKTAANLRGRRRYRCHCCRCHRYLRSSAQFRIEENYKKKVNQRGAPASSI